MIAESSPGLDDLYPPSPTGDAPEAEPTTAYRLRVIGVLLSLFLFLAIYFALVVGCGYLVYWSLVMPWPEDRGALLKIGAIFGTVMLFLFFLKGLFKRSDRPTEEFVRISENEQPMLFAFVRKLCSESGTHFPKNIYLSHDINAAVFYPRSLLSLFLPVRKNLLVGLGLVNLLNISELKAVIAHEFGHFAQSSMKLGQYVYVANQVIADMVFGRDRWDNLLAHWRGIDLRLSFPAWIITGIVWVLRHLLGLLFRAINLLNFSLSRQMEFNADLHAVRLTGSDALISGLWKTERGVIAYRMAMSELATLARLRKYSDDVFYHHERSLERLGDLFKKEKEVDDTTQPLKQPYCYGEQLHFRESQASQTTMWDTHPSHHDREENAKQHYVAATPLEVSAWQLFQVPGALRSKLSRKAYLADLGTLLTHKDNVISAKEAEGLIAAERNEVEQAEHYHGFYDSRMLCLEDTDALAVEIDALVAREELDAERLRDEVRPWTGADLEAFMKEHTACMERLGELRAFDLSGESSIELDGKTVTRGQVAQLVTPLEEQRTANLKKVEDADRAIFRYFYHLSGTDDESNDSRDELQVRYRFAVSVQALVGKLNELEAETDSVMQALQSGQQLSEEGVQYLHKLFGRGCKALAEVLSESRQVCLPKLANLAEGVALHSVLTAGGQPPERVPAELSGDWINSYASGYYETLTQLRNLHFKNLGSLLRLQEKLDSELYANPSREDHEAESRREPTSGSS